MCLSFCPSFRLSVSFLRIGSLVFFWNLACCQGLFYSCIWQPDFLEKNPHWVKMTKNGPKWSKSRVFGLFKKITSLVLPRICVKWKLLWFINILRKLSAKEISVFFNRRYFTNRLISHFDFWHVDRHEWKEQGSLTGFLKKFSFGQMGHFGSKIVHPHNPVSAGRIYFWNFTQWKGLIVRWKWF